MIPLFKVAMNPSAADRAREVIMSGYVGQGPINDEFEGSLRQWFDTPLVATTNSATSAEHLAFHLFKQFGLKEGDEVLTTSMTCFATNSPVVANGLNPKWVDVDPETLNLDLNDLESKLSNRTKVLYVVHWGGYPVDLQRLTNIADRAELTYGFRPFILEDCAHAFGSRLHGKPIGSHGNTCTFSFQAIKSLTALDGGALVCKDQEMYRRARLQRWFGIDRDDKSKTDLRCENNVEIAGHKFHMNDVNAVVGLENLKIVDGNIARHRANSAYYDENLKDVEGVKLLRRHAGFDSSCWIYSLLVERREDFKRMMEENGIHTSQVHQRNDFNSCFKDFLSPLPALDLVISKVSAIPNGFWVTDEDRARIVDLIKGGW